MYVCNTSEKHRATKTLQKDMYAVYIVLIPWWDESGYERCPSQRQALAVEIWMEVNS